MELFRQTRIDFLGMRRYMLTFSTVLFVGSIASLILKGGPKWGIDFRGGTVFYLKWREQPPVAAIRSALEGRIAGEITVQEMTGYREVMVGTEMRDERQLDAARRTITAMLEEKFAKTGSKLDFSNAGRQALIDRLRDPLQRNSVPLSEQDLRELADRMLAFRDRERSGVLNSLEELAGVPGVTPAVLATVKQECGLAPFSIRQVEIVGPKVGADLRQKALLATLYAMGGMLVYIALRFEFISGVAAVVALIHDTVITIGFFSFFNREISLTVIAAILTLIGYSMNDTIVVYDRIRENVKLRFRGKFRELVNSSINQTLSRTVLTSGLTLLTTVALYYLGGPVLNNIAFALIIGIVFGTYSSIFIAGVILVAWQEWVEGRRKVRGSPAAVPVSNAKETARRRPAKAGRQI